jgi:NADH/NAD ratio-sensing transcriptional regulator Rex
MSKPVSIGVIGAGTISDTYLENLTNFADTEVLAIGDLFPEAAREKAAKYEVPDAGDVATVLDHPDVEIVVNLTIPAAHAEVATQVIKAASTSGTRNLWPLIASAGEACSVTPRKLGCWLAVHRIRSWVLGFRPPAGLPSRA